MIDIIIAMEQWPDLGRIGRNLEKQRLMINSIKPIPRYRNIDQFCALFDMHATHLPWSRVTMSLVETCEQLDAVFNVH